MKDECSTVGLIQCNILTSNRKQRMHVVFIGDQTAVA